MFFRLHRAPPEGTRRRIGRRSFGVAILAGCSVLVGLHPGRTAEPEPFIVIVNAKNPVTAANRAFLADAFLKKTTRWDDGGTIRPADLEPSSKVRAAFSKRVLERSVAAVRSYWQQRIFSGRDTPPPELASDDAVVEFVERNPGAVGYVSGTARLRGAKVISVQ